MIRCVVFDFGEVIASAPTLFSAPAALLGVDPAAYEALYWQGRHAYDAGCVDAAYWTPILAGLGRPTTPEMIRHLASLDAELWAAGARPEALALLDEVRAAGRTVAVLSNAPFALDLAFADAPYADAADYWFVSASMGVTKPDAAAYVRVQQVVDAEAGEIAFVDDREPNVAKASALGWKAHLWRSDADTRAWLVEIGVLDAA